MWWTLPYLTDSSFCHGPIISLIDSSPPSVHIYASVNRVSIGWDNGLLPIRRQAIISTNVGLLSIGTLGTNFNEILIKIQNFSLTKMHLKISSAKWRPFCPGGDELFVGQNALALNPITDLILYHSEKKIEYICGGLNHIFFFQFFSNLGVVNLETCLCSRHLTSFATKWLVNIVYFLANLMVSVESRIFRCVLFIIPSMKSMRGILVSPCSSVRSSVHLSVCGQNRVRSVSSTISVGSISYLHILSSRRCDACKVCYKIHRFKILPNSLNLWIWLCLLLIWDVIWINSMGNHEAAGGILRTKAF